MEGCIQYNIVWLSLTVTSDRTMFFPGKPLSSINKTDPQNVTDIVLIVELSTIA